MSGYPDFKVLLVDDEQAWLRSFRRLLRQEAGIGNVLVCSDGAQVPSLFEEHDIGLVLLDLNMPFVSGETVLRQIRRCSPQTKVIILSGVNDVSCAVRCLKDGAFDYYIKGSDEEKMLAGITNAIRMAELERQSHRTKKALLERSFVRPEAFAHILTSSQVMSDIFLYIETISRSPFPVFITGESGTGKELLARAVHNASGCPGQFVSVNMASLEDSMLEDTLFGHDKGAFTNAQASRRGLAREAENGTLFLDEIGEISPPTQAKLLRFLQEGEYYPLGSDKKARVKARIVLATNQDVAQRMKDGRFRSDLYYRLMTHHIRVPPLRERKEDIPLLISHFIEQAVAHTGQKAPAIAGETLLRLAEYSYPGNIRELQAMLTHAAMSGKQTLGLEDFPVIQDLSPENAGNSGREQKLLDFFLHMEAMPSFNDVKKIMTTAALTRTGGNQTAAARILGISQPALSMRMRS